MHKCLIVVILLLFYFLPDVLAQQEQDIVYLKNGRKLMGKIITLIPDVSVTIRTVEGATLTYSMQNVLRIDKKQVEDEKVVKKSVKNKRNRFFLGSGIGFYSYVTSWYYSDYQPNYSTEYHYPWHVFSRQQLFLFFEKQSLFKFGPLHLDIKFDIQFGISGGTEEDWLPLGESISGGGETYAASLIFDIAYPLKTTSKFSFAPFVGIGFQYSALVSDGTNIGQEYASRSAYRYDEGWAEDVYGMILPMGLEFEINKILLIAEYRLLIVGGSDTDWDPRGYEVVEEDGPSINAFSISVGFKL